jgi:hypothetical protein
MNKIVFCQNIKEMYHTKCNDFVLAEVAELELKFVALFIGFSGIIYLKNNKEILYELLFQLGYNSSLAITKISNLYNRIKHIFVSSNNANTKNTYIYDEVKVIKNGVRCATFETMTTFEESSYLGNPNEYYDIEESETESSESATSSCFDSDTVNNSTISSSQSSSPSSQSSQHSNSELEKLFIMEKNESDNTLEFKTFDFIMHTNYKYPDSFETSKQNYTKIYRTFTRYDFYSDKTKYEPSNTEMIICNLEIDGDDTEYEIDLSQPYNFNVVGNLILDEKFVTWYILKKYNYVIEPSINYKITCITRDIKTFQLDRSDGLRVHLYDYEKISKESEILRSKYFLHL